MKNKIVFSLIVFLYTVSILSQEPITEIDPPNWWVNMNSSSFQLMLHGEDIANGELKVINPKVKIKKTNTMKNPNYLFVDIEILDNNEPFDFDINFSKDGIRACYFANASHG